MSSATDASAAVARPSGPMRFCRAVSAMARTVSEKDYR